MRSNEIIKALIGNMGAIIEIEEDVLGLCGWRHVKVMLDTSMPLRRFRKIKDKKGNEIQIDFAYEHLPFFCLACGIMGHSKKDCHVVFDEDKCEKMGWHLGLKATPRKGRNKEIEGEVKFRNCKKIMFDPISSMHKDKVVVEVNDIDDELHAPTPCMAQNSSVILEASQVGTCVTLPLPPKSNVLIVPTVSNEL